MDITRIDVDSDEQVAQLFALDTAVQAADRPEMPAPCSVEFAPNLRLPRSAEETLHRAAWIDGRIVGRMSLMLPTQDNLHFADASVRVHPQYRRRGVGRALLETGMQLAREADRRTLAAGTFANWEGGAPRSEAGRRFLESMGFTVALTEVMRVAEVDAIDPAVEQRLYDEALAAADGYELVAWTGKSPEELVEPMARLNSSFLDEAPTGEFQLERENIDVERMRAMEERSAACGYFVSGVAARPKGSAEVVADTVVGVSSEPGDFAGQWITLVDPKHRGHKLGMLVKLENLRQLRRERPQVRRIITGNADVNSHMIAINEQLGFKPTEALYEYQRQL